MARENRAHIVVGHLAPSGGHRFWNKALLFSPKGLVGEYVKTTPYWRLEGDYIEGDGVEVFETGIGRVATLICWEVWFPELARLAALKGAELICFPTAKGHINRLWQALFLVRAVENNAIVIMSTFASRGISSMICCPDGSSKRGRGSGITSAEFDVDRMREIREDEGIGDDFEPALLNRRGSFLKKVGRGMLSP